MTDPSHESRITDLEIKLTYQDDLIKTLNDVIVDLQAQIERIRLRAKVVEQSLVGKQDDSIQGDDKPPHY